MTFASDTVRYLYHQLPAERQVEFLNWEERIAARGERLNVDAVMAFGSVSEVVVRITIDYKGNAVSGDSGTRA